MDLDYISSRLGILKLMQTIFSLLIFVFLCAGGYFADFSVVYLYFEFDFTALASAACFLYGCVTYACHLFGVLKIHRWVLYDEEDGIKFSRMEMWLSVSFSLIFWTAMLIIFVTASDVNQRKALPNRTTYILAGIVSEMLATISGHYAYQIACKVYPRIQITARSRLDQDNFTVPDPGAAAIIISTQ